MTDPSGPIVGGDGQGRAGVLAGSLCRSGSDLLEEVNGAVIEIGRDGTLDTLQERWFGTS